MTRTQARLFYIIGFSLVCANSAISMFISTYFKEIKINEKTIGQLIAIFNMMLPAVILALGFISDRMSCKKLIISGNIIFFIYALVMPYITNVHSLALMKILGGTGLTLSFIPLNILFLKKLAGENQGKRLAVFVSAMTFGYAAGTSLSSLSITYFGFSTVSVFYIGLPFIFLSLSLSLLLPESSIDKFPVAEYFHDLKSFPVFYLAIIAFTLGLHWGSENYVLIRFLKNHLKTSGFQMCLLFILEGFLVYYFSRFAGKLADKNGNIASMIVWGMLISGLLHAASRFATTYTGFLALRIAHNCGDGIVVFFMPMLVKLAFKNSRLGGNFGFSRMINSIGSATGVFISGIIVSKYFIGDPFIATGLMQSGAAVILFLTRHRLPSSMPKPSEIPRESFPPANID